ncbi:erythromycin esterase family protein, partial [Candidatus Bathyarchaeota archaeon]|nr:erythromycin esterase family protein [Candidatus Bathyarchaeota archaeon]
KGVKRWTLGYTFNEEEREMYRNMYIERLSDYTSLKEYIDENRFQFQESTDREIETALYYLQSRIDYIHWRDFDSTYVSVPFKGTHLERASKLKVLLAYRDYLMAQNLKFLAEYLFPDKKIIVWAQNAHIAKYPYRMYAELNEIAPAYSISFYCYSGQGDNTFGQGFDGTNPDSMTYQFITPQDPLSIAQLLHASGHDITFVNMQNQTETEGNSWMFNIAKTHDWDGSELEEEGNIRNSWDAIILINNTTTPKYLEYEYDYLDNNIKGYNKR